MTHTGRITLLLTVYVLPNNAQAFLWRQNMQDYVLIHKTFKRVLLWVLIFIVFMFRMLFIYITHLYICTYMHTYIHTCTHVYIQTYIHICTHTYILTLLMFLLQCAGLLGQEAAPRCLGTSAICLGELSFFGSFMPVADRKALSMVVVTFFTNQS